jgi:hypothetical protein
LNRQEWIAHYQDVRTPIDGVNLFPREQRAEIALLMLRLEIQTKRKEDREAKYSRN